MAALISGYDLVLCVPPGAGKTMVSWAFPLVLLGSHTDAFVVFIIVPYIALVIEQVGRLRSLGFTVTRVPDELNLLTLQQVKDGKFQYVYMSPEVIVAEVSMLSTDILRERAVAFVLDEADIVLWWGMHPVELEKELNSLYEHAAQRHHSVETSENRPPKNRKKGTAKSFRPAFLELGKVVSAAGPNSRWIVQSGH